MIASLLRHLFGQEEEVYQTTDSCCIHTELVEELENTTEHNSEAFIYPNNISSSIQPSIVDKALTIDKDQCDLVYTAITQSSLKTSCYFTPNKKGTDLISRIKQIYDECKCEKCDCIAGTKVSSASLPRPKPPQPHSTKKGTCKCIPCDCLTCAKMPLLKQQSKEVSIIETNDFLKDEDKFIWKESFFSSFERAVNACTCRPCDCVTCNKVKLEDKVKKEVETQTTPHYKTFNYKCRCNPCECLFCKALSDPECKCAPCKCETCPNLFLTHKSIDVNSACAFNKPSTRDCAPFVLSPKEKKPKVTIKKVKALEKLEIKKISLTKLIEYKENMPLFYQRVVGNTTVPEMTECKEQIPKMPNTITIEGYNEPENKSECDCAPCYCVQCTKKKFNTANLSHSTSVTNDTHDEINTECICGICECEVCDKGGRMCEDVPCQCKDDKDQCTPDFICSSKKCKRNKVDLKYKNCKQCLNKIINHHQCMNESCECEKCSDEPDGVFNVDGRIFPFLKSETNIFAIPTISRGRLNVQKITKEVSNALHADIYKHTKIFMSTFNAPDIGEKISHLKRHTVSTMRYLDNLKLAYANNEADPFAQADVQEEYDSNLNYCKEKELDNSIFHPIHHSDECIPNNYLRNIEIKRSEMSDLLAIVSHMDEDMTFKNYFPLCRQTKIKSCESNYTISQ